MFVARLLNAFFPPICSACGEKTESANGLCADCFSRLQFIHDQLKGRASAVVYNEKSRELLLALKYGDRADIAPLMARLMVSAGKDVLDGADVLIPVPLHWRRLFVRKYNQAAILADEVSKISRIPSDAFILKRWKATPKQGAKFDRFENVKGAFSLNPKKNISGKVVIVVDDVITTGATLSSCAAVLYHSGAKEVRFLTFAKVVD